MPPKLIHLQHDPRLFHNEMLTVPLRLGYIFFSFLSCVQVSKRCFIVLGQTRHEGSPAPSGNLRSLPCARPSTATHHQCKRSCSFGRWSGDSDSASRPESSRSFTTSVLIDRACAHLKFRCWPKGTTKQWYQAQTLPSCAQPTKVQMLIRRTWKEKSG